MRRKLVWWVLLLFFTAALLLFTVQARGFLPSLLIRGKLDHQATERFARLLKQDPMTKSFSTYNRQPHGFLQDKHNRRRVNASIVMMNGEALIPPTIRIIHGRFLHTSDSGKIVLSKQHASTLFAKYDCINRTMLVNGEPFTVVGVYQTKEPLAWLSSIGEPEAYLTDESIQGNWVIQAVPEKEAQREASLQSTLEWLGAENVQVDSLFRRKMMVLFSVQMHFIAIVFIIFYRVSKLLLRRNHVSRPHTNTLLKLMKRLQIAAYVLIALHLLPVPNSYLPSAVSVQEITKKLSELIAEWNTHRSLPSSEGIYLQWLLRAVLSSISLSWICILRITRKEDEQHAQTP